MLFRLQIRPPSDAELLEDRLRQSHLQDGDHAGNTSRARKVLVVSDRGSRICVLSPKTVESGSDERHAALRWYFEQYPVRDPFASSRADAVQRGLHEFGKGLITEVFLSSIYHSYSQQDHLLIEIHDAHARDGDDTTSWLGRLSWEILENKTLWSKIVTAYSFEPRRIHVVRVHASQRTIQRRATDHKMSASEKKDYGRNVVAVTARPSARDIPHRLITRSIASAIRTVDKSTDRTARLQIVRPGTLEALVRILGEHPNGFFDVLHLDMHGEADENG